MDATFGGEIGEIETDRLISAVRQTRGRTCFRCGLRTCLPHGLRHFGLPDAIRATALG